MQTITQNPGEKKRTKIQPKEKSRAATLEAKETVVNLLLISVVSVLLCLLSSSSVLHRLGLYLCSRLLVLAVTAPSSFLSVRSLLSFWLPVCHLLVMLLSLQSSLSSSDHATAGTIISTAFFSLCVYSTSPLFSPLLCFTGFWFAFIL